MMPSTVVYREFMAALEGRRVELGLSMATVNDMAGLQDGFFAKMLYPDTPSGRQARWETVQLAVEALFGKGFTVHIVAGEDENLRVTSAPVISADVSSNARKIRHWRHSRHFSELGKKGAEARSKMPKRKLTAIYRKAALKRWKRVREAERMARKHHEANAEKRKVRHIQPSTAADVSRNPADVRLRPRKRGAAPQGEHV